MDYNEWIKNNIVDSYGKCAEKTAEMQRVFPELKRIRGHYVCPLGGRRQHWWLLTAEGEIIDPTASQFLDKGKCGEYIPWDEGQREPVGKCLNCGELIYNSGLFCSDNCRIESLRLYGLCKDKSEGHRL